MTNNQLANTRQSMQRKMVKIQLQTKLKRTINNINNKNTPYDIKEFRSNPENVRMTLEV